MKVIRLSTENHLAILSFHSPQNNIVRVNKKFLDEFEAMLLTLEEEDSIKAVLLLGDKRGFVDGLDLSYLSELKENNDAYFFSRRFNKLLSRLNAFEKPVIAAVSEAVTGPGMDLFLATHYRMAADHPSTSFCYPEIRFGLCPAGGGTQRLPALIGLSKALHLLLEGNRISAPDALKMGITDELIFPQVLPEAAKALAHDLIEALSFSNDRNGKKHPFRQILFSNKEKSNEKGFRLFSSRFQPDRKRGFKITEEPFFSRRLVFSRIEKKIRAKTRGLMPAPHALLEAVKFGVKEGLSRGLDFEARTFEKLLHTTESRQLICNYFTRKEARKNPFTIQTDQINEIGIVGAGLMGSGITSLSIKKGFKVTLKERNFPSAIRAKEKAWKDLQEGYGRPSLSSYQKERLISGIHLTNRYNDLKGLPLVIEAVYEELAVKHQVLKELESIMQEGAILATNTSAIPITDIARGSRHPENIIGLHYLSPAQKMPLVEIIRSKKTSQKVVASVCDVALRQGKHLLVVEDSPGFYVTRIIIPMINEAMLLIEEGADIRIIDTAVRNFGFPVGPVMLVDEVGIDVVSRVVETLQPLFKKRGIRLSQAPHRLYESGYSGRKNKRGFYNYRSKTKLIQNEVYPFFGPAGRKDFSLEEISERITLVMINEAAHSLQEGIIQSPESGDFGAVLGMGFPAFKGGPFRYLDQKGVKWVCNRLEHWQKKYGDRFRPAPILFDQIKKGSTFYS